MLGNFSLGDYFKEGAVEYAWELSQEVFGFDPADIWVTVFEGDEELGLGPDEEAIEAWLAIGVPHERIVPCPRSENFWQAGPTGPCGPCSELYLDRGLEWGTTDDLPGGDNERFLEYWNLVFMQLNLDAAGKLTPLPQQNIDTGLGLNRMALIQQGTDDDLRDRPVPAADRAGRGAVRAPLRRGLRRRPGAAHPRRPHARDVVPDRRRRRAVERRPRLRPAPGHAPRDPAGPADRDRGRVPAALRRGRAGDDGGRLPRAARAGGHGGHVARARGAGVRADARAGHADPRRAHRARQGARRGGDRRRGCVPAARHLRLPVRADRRAGGRAGPRRRRAGLREPDGGPARARAGGPLARRGGHRARSRPGLRGRRGVRHDVHGLRADGAGHRGRRRHQRRTGRCWRSWSSPRSTRPAAGRWPTSASSSARRATAGRAWSTSCAWATTRRSCSSPRRASCTRASG